MKAGTLLAKMAAAGACSSSGQVIAPNKNTANPSSPVSSLFARSRQQNHKKYRQAPRFHAKAPSNQKQASGTPPPRPSSVNHKMCSEGEVHRVPALSPNTGQYWCWIAQRDQTVLGRDVTGYRVLKTRLKIRYSATPTKHSHFDRCA